jgi:DNA-binding protein H-NS
LPTYEELQQQISELQQEAKLVRDAKVAGVVAGIKEVIKVYGLTAEDIFGRVRKVSRKRRAGSSTPRPPKYQDPQTGRTWSGLGKPPRWITEVSDRQYFLIVKLEARGE